MTYQRVLGTAALGALLLGAGGCVFDDIHEQLQSNEQVLLRVESVMSDGTATMLRLEAQLADLNARNAELQERLDRQHEILQSIDRSLAALDVHLVALRSMIDAIPFVSFGSNPEEAPADSAETPAEGEDAGAVEEAPSEPAPESEPTDDTPPTDEPEPSPERR